MTARGVIVREPVKAAQVEDFTIEPPADRRCVSGFWLVASVTPIIR